MERGKKTGAVVAVLFAVVVVVVVGIIVAVTVASTGAPAAATPERKDTDLAPTAPTDAAPSGAANVKIPTLSDLTGVDPSSFTVSSAKEMLASALKFK